MSLEDLRFKTNLFSNNVARPNKFRVFIPLPETVSAFIDEQQANNGGVLPEWAQKALRIGSIALGGGAYSERGLQFTCLMAPLPATQILIEESKINGHVMHYATGITRDSINFSFLLSGDFYEKTIFDKWVNFMVDEKSRKVAYYDDYVVDITIEALDIFDNVVYTLNMIDSHPITVDLVQLDKSQTDQYAMMNVSFYMKYITNDELAKETESPFTGNIGGLIEGLSSGDLEQAAYSARMLLIQAMNGDFTGEAAAAYSKIYELIKESAGVSLPDLNKMMGGLSTMVNKSIGISQSDKNKLNSILEKF